MKGRIIVFSMLLFATSVLVSPFIKTSFAVEPIKIGVIHDLSGPAASYGVPMLKGHEVARDEYNAAGGLLGRQIKYFVRDHKLKSDVARRSAEELILKEKVEFLLGVSGTPCGFAVSAAAKQYKVPYVDGGIKSPQLTEEFGHKYVATVAADSVYEGGAMAILEKDTPYKKYWLIGWDYAYCHNVLNDFKEKLKKIKPSAKIVGESWVKLGETELTPYITTILARKADAIAGMLMGASLQAFCKQAEPYGLLKKVHMINGAIMGNAEFLRPTGKDIPDGVVLNTWHHPDYPNTPANKAFVKRYLDMTGASYVPGNSAQLYISSKLLFEAIKKAGTTDAKKVMNSLTTIEMDTPRSTEKLSIRKCDQKSNLGEIWGTTKYDSKAGYVKLVNPTYISSEGLRHSCQEVKAKRVKARRK